jgi:DNA-binding CsgD family transcriptional regulator
MLGQGFRSPRIFVLANERGWVSGGFASCADRAMERSEVERLDSILPHLARGLRLWAEVGRLRHAEMTLSAALDLMDAGVLLLDRDLRILFSNACAEAVLSAQDGLYAASERLGVTSPRQHRDLQDHVAEVAKLNGARAGQHGAWLAIPRPSGLPALALHIYPAAAATDGSRCRSAAALVVVRDPVQDNEPADVALLGGLWNLTPAEARVARLAPLATGKRQIAEILGLSENTVKSHLAAIRAKVGARSVGELATMVRRTTVAAVPRRME